MATLLFFGRSEEARLRNIKHMVGVLLSVVCLVVLSVAAGRQGACAHGSTGLRQRPERIPLNNAIIDYRTRGITA